MEPVVYDLSINEHGAMATVLEGRRAMMSAGYYASVTPKRFRRSVPNGSGGGRTVRGRTRGWALADHRYCVVPRKPSAIAPSSGMLAGLPSKFQASCTSMPSKPCLRVTSAQNRKRGSSVDGEPGSHRTRGARLWLACSHGRLRPVQGGVASNGVVGMPDDHALAVCCLSGRKLICTLLLSAAAMRRSMARLWPS